jgi:hypothetical protein
MIHLHYCSSCKQIFLLCGHQQACIKCSDTLIELRLSYSNYIDFSPVERQELLHHLLDDEYLKTMKQPYRFAKRTKRYNLWNEKRLRS